MRVLVLNSGSSSVKFRVLEDADGGDEYATLLGGAIRGIGGVGTLEVQAHGQTVFSDQREVADYESAFAWLFDGESGQRIRATGVDAVGHRIVHGGDRFPAAVVIDETVMAEIDALGDLAPLHNPASLAGIHRARQSLGEVVPMVAVFDTAFHHAMPERSRLYALPRDLAARHRIRRYGFHGIAHASLLAGYLRAAGRHPGGSRVITLQLGNGCSAAAIADGQSVDTSMGFTPLEGLVMGTRSGDLDPAVVTYLCDAEGVSPDQVEQWLNEESGLLGLSGRSNDMRELLAAVTQEKHAPSTLAVELFCYRAKKYVGAYLAALGGADAIVFGGGIGESSPDIRTRICDGLGWCGVVLEPEKNAGAVGLAPGQSMPISADDANVDVYVVAADEESWIARETLGCVRASV